MSYSLLLTQHATYDENDPELKLKDLKRLHNTISESYMALILFKLLHLWNCHLGSAEIFRSELKFKERDLWHNLKYDGLTRHCIYQEAKKEQARNWKWKNCAKVRKDWRLSMRPQNKEIMPQDEVQDMYVWAMIIGCSRVAWPLHNSSYRVLPLPKEMLMNETQQKLAFWWGGDEHLLGFCFQLFFQIIDLTLQRGNGGLGLGPLSSLQFYQLCLQVLVLPFEQHSPCLQFLCCWSFRCQIYKLSSNTTKI